METALPRKSAAILAWAFAFCPATSDAMDEETAAMVERLAALERSQDPWTNVYLNGQRAVSMKQALSNQKPIGQQITDRFLLAHEYVRANQNAEAIDIMEQINSVIAGIPKESIGPIIRKFNHLYALAWIRYGEQENCIHHHASDSCLFPISGNGIHQLKRGSTEAARIVSEHLQFDPKDQGARWLLNIAAMTLGNYPEGVSPLC